MVIVSLTMLSGDESNLPFSMWHILQSFPLIFAIVLRPNRTIAISFPGNDEKTQLTGEVNTKGTFQHRHIKPSFGDLCEFAALWRQQTRTEPAWLCLEHKAQDSFFSRLTFPGKRLWGPGVARSKSMELWIFWAKIMDARQRSCCTSAGCLFSMGRTIETP